MTGCSARYTGASHTSELYQAFQQKGELMMQIVPVCLLLQWLQTVETSMRPL
jgi:hypothetical protein